MEVLQWIKWALHNTRPVRQRGLYIAGPPGCGKTQVLLAAIRKHALEGFKVLVACPTGALVAAYRASLGQLPNVTVQTLHSAFALLGRPGTYTPPGCYSLACTPMMHCCTACPHRVATAPSLLLHPLSCTCLAGGTLHDFDFLVFDEISQIGWIIWSRIAAAVSEMHASPVVALLGDFQQLQPLDGAPLRAALLHEIALGTSRTQLRSCLLAC